MNFQRRGAAVSGVVLRPSKTKGNAPAEMEVIGVPQKENLTIVSSEPKLVEVTGVKRKSPTSFEFKLNVLASEPPERTITITATAKDAKVTLTVTIEAPIALPDRNTDEGAVTRLLMAEARGPSNKSYSEADSRKSMQWMKLVLENRLANNPAQFNARGATSLTDIIKARGQFAGFSNYPNYDNDTRTRLQTMIDIANSDNDQRAPAFRQFIQNAIDVAGAEKVEDPATPAFLAAWRTEGAGAPGGRFKEFQSLAGNTFYKLE